MKLSKQLFLALAISTGSLGAEPTLTDTIEQLTIRVYDYADISPKLFERARKQATQILENAGVAHRWEQCRTSESETNQDGSCTQRAGAHVIQLRIHPRYMAKKLTERSIEFGYSLPLTDGFGIIAGVYLERTAQMVRPLGLDLHVVLGHTMAHEIGHLLLGSNSHARRGIMGPTWRDRELRLAGSGVLGFTDEQAEAMQAQVEARLMLTYINNQASRPGKADPPKRPQATPTVNVRIFNYSDVSRAVFSKAQKEARRIFRRSGIETNWIECAITNQGGMRDPRCTAQTKAHDIMMRIVPKEMVDSKRHGEFGVAFIALDGGFGKYASVFYTRVQEYAQRWQASEGPLLGHLIAHEMGHLLLGANSHSRSGIMNVPWSRKKIERASLGTLLFTDQEATRMRTQVAERIALAGQSRRAGD